MLKIFKGPLKALFWTPKASPKPAKPSPKTLQNGAKMPQKSMCKTACIFEALLYRFFSIFDLKIDGFLNPFCMQFSSKCQKCETWKICILPRENQYFQGFEHSNRHQKTAENPSKIKVRKNILKNAIKIDFGTHFGLQNPSKIHSKALGKRRRIRRRKKWPQEPSKNNLS